MADGYGRREAYRSGNKVYGSGRNSPHMGTRLDPSGYIDRELKRRRLDRRSRLASAALNRMDRRGKRDGKQTDADRRKFTGIPGRQNPSATGMQFNPVSAGTVNSNPNLPQGQNGGGNTPGPEEPPVGPFTPPRVDLNGKLIPMPWEMQMDWMNAATELAQQNAQWDSEIGQAGIDLGTTLRDLARQKIVDKRNIAGQNAARGMTFSSGNAQDITENEAAYAEANSGAQNWYDQLLGQYGVGGVQRSLAQSSFDNYAAILQAEAARRLAERAGTLGLGQDINEPGPQAPKPKPNKPGGNKPGGNKPKNKRDKRRPNRGGVDDGRPVIKRRRRR